MSTLKKWLFRKSTISIALCVALVVIYSIFQFVRHVQAEVAKMQAPGETVTYFPSYAPLSDRPGSDTALLKRGEYLTKAGDCIACHTNTPKKGKTFAGGLPIQTPFGTIYSPNITPDKKTGIGNWTDAQFLKAMHDGISPQGEYYYPAFPYIYFNKVTDDDVQAIWAYLKQIPAVDQANQENTMVFPFNWRFLQLGWRIMFFVTQKTGPYQPNSAHSATWNRGAYLVEGLGHCAMCHTPSYNIFSEDLPLGAPIQQYNLTGAKVQGYLAPNITQSNIGGVSDDEVIKVFTENRMIGGGKIEGPMLEANQDSLKYLSIDDLGAMVQYLKSVKSKSPPVKTSSSAPGAATYETYCAACHTRGAGGAPKYGDKGDWDPLIKKQGINTVYTNALKGINAMPAKGTCLSCTDTQIKDAVDYMIASTTGAASSASSAVKSSYKPVIDTKKSYETHCAACHAAGKNGAPIPGDVQTWKPIVAAGFLDAYTKIKSGEHGKQIEKTCATCSDADLIAALKYMMQVSAPGKNYNLW